MNAVAKLLRRDSETTPEVSGVIIVAERKIRYMSRSRARKAGKWAIKKYPGVFKKLAA